MNKDCIISVIICTKNRPQFLLKSIDSVLLQTYSNWELIIVDDGSAVPVSTVVEKYLEYSCVNISYVRHDVSLGVAIARNEGVKYSSGSYIYFLDDDDLLVNTALMDLIEASINFKLECVFHGILPFGKESEIKKEELRLAMARVFHGLKATELKKGIICFDKDLYKNLLISVPVCFQKCLFMRTLWEKTGGMRINAEMPEPEWSVKAALLGRCGLLSKDVYLWRVEDQNFFSLKKDDNKIGLRVVDNMKALLIFCRNNFKNESHICYYVQCALSDAYFNLSWQAYVNNRYIEALVMLYKSSIVVVRLRYFNFLLKIILKSVKWYFSLKYLKA